MQVMISKIGHQEGYGRPYYSDPIGGWMINYDIVDYLEDELSDLAAIYGLETIIDTAIGPCGRFTGPARVISSRC